MPTNYIQPFNFEDTFGGTFDAISFPEFDLTYGKYSAVTEFEISKVELRDDWFYGSVQNYMIASFDSVEYFEDAPYVYESGVEYQLYMTPASRG